MTELRGVWTARRIFQASGPWLPLFQQRGLRMRMPGRDQNNTWAPVQIFHGSIEETTRSPGKGGGITPGNNNLIRKINEHRAGVAQTDGDPELRFSALGDGYSSCSGRWWARGQAPERWVGVVSTVTRKQLQEDAINMRVGEAEGVVNDSEISVRLTGDGGLKSTRSCFILVSQQPAPSNWQCWYSVPSVKASLSL